MATVAVTNTTANLSGKTLTVAELVATITALWTFNRGVNAPFAVPSGSAKVDNFDADKLDGVEGAGYAEIGNTETIASVWTFSAKPLINAGLQFPATQAADAGVNVLDDYEEGTWTPSVGGTATYTTQAGKYTKIGNLVHIDGHLVINAIGSGSTGTVTGLPFAAAAITGGSVGLFLASATSYTFVSCYVNASSVLFTAIAGAGTNMSNPGVLFGNGTDVYFSATYKV